MVFFEAWNNLYPPSQHPVLGLVSSPLFQSPSPHPSPCQVILRPIFGLLTGEKLIVLTNPSELLEYFDEDQLPPHFLER
jgi:hypothetical protein